MTKRKLFVNLFRNLSEDAKMNERNLSYLDIGENSLNSMFTWGIPIPDIPNGYLESILHAWGMAGMCKDNDRVVVGRITLHGNVNSFGYGEDALITESNGNTHYRKKGDYVIIRNNYNMTPDLLMHRYCNLLSEVDLSMNYGVENTRIAPIPVCSNSVVKSAIEKVLTKIGRTREHTPIVANPTAMSNDPIKVINLTDPSLTDRLQYLSKFHDDILKRIYTIYGIPLQLINQGSNTLNGEIHAFDLMSRIIPFNMYECRLTACDDAKRILNIDMTCKFSRSCKHLADAWNGVSDGDSDGVNNGESDGVAD